MYSALPPLRRQDVADAPGTGLFHVERPSLHMTVATIARSLSRGGLAAARRGGQTPAGALLGRAIPVPGHHARLLVPGGAAVEPLATRRTGRGVRLTSAPRAPGPSADRQRRKNSEGAGAAWLARLTASRGLAARGPAKEAAGLSAGGYRAQRTLLRRHADSARAMPPLPLRRPPPVGRRRWPAAPPPPLRCRRTSLVRPVAALRRPPFARPRACYGGGPSSRPGRYDVGASGLVSPAVQHSRSDDSRALARYSIPRATRQQSSLGGAPHRATLPGRSRTCAGS